VTTLTTNPNVQTALNFFTSNGFSIAGASAATSVLFAESGLNTGAQGNQATDASGVLSNGQGAFGIASWNGPRQTQLANYASANGLDPSALTTQLQFFKSDLQTNFPSIASSVMNATDANSAVSDLVSTYENPAASNVAPEISNANGFAGQLQNFLQSNGTQAISSASPDSSDDVTVSDATQMGFNNQGQSVFGNLSGSTLGGLTGSQSTSPTSSASGQSTSTNASPSTVPAAINAQTAGQTADTAKSVSATNKAAQTAASTANADTTSAVSTAAGIAGSVETFFSGLFARLGVVSLGIIFVVVGLIFIVKNNGSSPRTA
jgi:trimeric autotransporter adhesin